MRDALLGRAFYLDTNVIIFAVEKENPWAMELGELTAAIDDQAIRAFTSELTLAEVLAKPISLGASALIAKYDEILAEDGPIGVVPVSRLILRASAELQARFGVKLADAIHLATARETGCDFIVTNDRELGRKAGSDFGWLTLADFTAPHPD